MIFGHQIKHFIKITRKNPTRSKKGINGQKILLEGVTGYVRTDLKKKTNSKSVSTPVGVLNVEFALKLRIYRSLNSLICLK